MPGEFEEGGVLFAHVIENADGSDLLACKPDNFAPRAAQLPLQGLHLLDGRVEVLLKKTVENVHEVRRDSRLGIHNKDNTEEQRQN